jgi:hypothetical protein
MEQGRQRGGHVVAVCLTRLGGVPGGRSVARSILPAAVFVLASIIGVVGLPATAWGQTLSAPVGGKPIPVGEARVACGSVDAGWVVEPGGRSVRPPAAATAAGVVAILKVAPSQAECAASTASVRLVGTAPWPVIDPAATVLAIDEERLQIRGHNLLGASVAWGGEHDAGSDTCHDPRTDAGVEICDLRIPKTVSADPTTGGLRWVPAGAPVTRDVDLFGSDGKPVAPEAFALPPARVELRQLVPADGSVDVSRGKGLVPLTHPEVFSDVDCGAVKCTIEAGNLAVQAPPASVGTIDVKAHLLPHVFLVHKNAAETAPVVRLTVLRCPMDVASGPALRNLDSARIVVRLAGACAKDVVSLSFFVGAHRADVVDVENIKDDAYVVLALGAVDTPSLSVTATREEGGGAVVGIARTETRRPPTVRTVLELGGFPSVDFIPSNRPAIVHYPKIDGAELTLLPVENVYVALNEGSISRVQGDPNAAGSVTLQFAYRVPTLPAPLDRLDLGLLSDALQRSVKVANIPAPFGIGPTSSAPLAELVCTENEGKVVRVVPGVTAHVPFRYRDACRVVLHRELLSPEYGTQKMVLTIDVNKIDGSPRGEAHLDQTFVMRSGVDPRIAWIKGVATPYDRAIVKLSHAPDESHYLGASELIGSAPVAQWTMIFGTGLVRLYATTAIPTGLYRFGDSKSSGVLSLSFGVISRFTWLDSDGKEGLLAVEAGVMAFGLSGDQSPTSGESLTQVGAVVGVGLAIPIANAGAPSQASINLHAWFEQRITGSGPEAGSEQALIFGPSISIGNVGTTF